MSVRFEKVSKYKDVEFELPQRKTHKAAGYDFTLPEDVIVPSHYKQVLKLIMAKLGSEEFLVDLMDLGIGDQLASLGDAQAKMSRLEIESASMEIISKLSEFGPLLNKHMSLTLDEMKELTKANDLRMTLVPTGVKAKLEDDQKLELMIRSSTPMGSYITMANNIGLIDADYYNNEGNEGHIFFQLVNLSPFDIKLEKGDIIGQGVISKFDKVVDDNTESERVGGLGSTEKK